MTVSELAEKLMLIEAKGYGRKDIVVEDSQQEFHIDSVQSNRNPGIVPDYFFLMAGEEYNNETNPLSKT